MIQSNRLKPLADVTPNTKLACIWETESSYKFGFTSILQSGPGLEAAGVKELLDYFGEYLFVMICAFSMTRILSGRMARS